MDDELETRSFRGWGFLPLSQLKGGLCQPIARP